MKKSTKRIIEIIGDYERCRKVGQVDLNGEEAVRVLVEGIITNAELEIVVFVLKACDGPVLRVTGILPRSKEMSEEDHEDMARKLTLDFGSGFFFFPVSAPVRGLYHSDDLIAKEVPSERVLIRAVSKACHAIERAFEEMGKIEGEKPAKSDNSKNDCTVVLAA